MTAHPTAAERFFFDNNGYLVLEIAEQWRYDRAFLQGLAPTQRRFFHGFVFDPPEYRWG